MQILKFEPLLKQTIWGGDKIIPFKHLAGNVTQVGESWELSGVGGSESVVSSGEYRGMSINDVIGMEKEKLVGCDNYRRFGNEFPLLVKFIDARDDLSIQVHPTDEIARRKGKRRGKTEMWYIMESEPKARLRSGLKRRITPDEYRQLVEEGSVCDVIAEYEVKAGDCFFLPAGRIHSICAGCFLAEIQQTSDVTYRIFDFNRKDKNGNYRELHTQEAAECIDYNVCDSYRTEYVPKKNQGVPLVDCRYFSTAVYDLDEPMTLDYSELDSFVVLIGISGGAVITDSEGNETLLRGGETLLVPASATSLDVNGKVKFLETYIPQ